VSSHVISEVRAQLMCATPARDWLEYADWWNPILKNSLEIRDGMAIVGDSIGSGVVWNETAVERYSAEGSLLRHPGKWSIPPG
jgi:mandelate racemase